MPSKKINKCIDGLNLSVVCRSLYIIITIKCFLFVIHAGYEGCDIPEISGIPEEKKLKHRYARVEFI